MKKIDLPEIHSQIILGFLTKLELMTTGERAEILRTIALINNPIFISGNSTYEV
jgi:hypothetical protein